LIEKRLEMSSDSEKKPGKSRMVSPHRKIKGIEQNGLSVGRESCRPQGWSLTLKSWYSFEIAIADAESFNVRRRQYRSIRYGRECGGPPESTGRGMQEEIRRRTREAPKVPENSFLNEECLRIQ